MEIKIREVLHTSDEIAMGQVIHYLPLPEADAVSVTANAAGFTTMTAVARHWNISLDQATAIADHANKLKHKCPWSLVLEEPKWRCLITVPRTYGQSDSEAMTRKILEDTRGERVKILEFSHYNFIQKTFPEIEIASAIRAMRAWHDSDGIDTVIFDIDCRFLATLSKLMGGSCMID